MDQDRKRVILWAEKESPVANTVLKLIAGSSLFTKVLADILSVIYLLTLVLKHATKSYTRPLPAS